MKQMAVILIIAAVGAMAGERGMFPRVNFVEALGLTPAQATAWENAERSFHEAIHPLLEQQTALRRGLEQSLMSKADACSIGAQEQQIFAIGEQIKSAKQSFDQQRDSILTPEQKSKLAALRQEREGREMKERIPIE